MDDAQMHECTNKGSAVHSIFLAIGILADSATMREVNDSTTSDEGLDEPS
jgi:hypothetical protein